MPGSAVGWIAMLCMDTTVFIMTLVKTSQMRSYAHHGLFSVLFRDGKLQEPILSLYNRLSSLALRCRVLRVRILGSSHTSRRNDFLYQGASSCRCCQSTYFPGETWIFHGHLNVLH